MQIDGGSTSVCLFTSTDVTSLRERLARQRDCVSATVAKPGGVLYDHGMSDVTRILEAIDRGDPAASSKLLPLVYDELRRLANAKMAHEPVDQTLQPTALVHEAYLRLVQADQPGEWDSRGHFFAAAAEAMRRILVENARRKNRLKHGGEWKRVALNDVAAPELALPDGAAPEPEDQLLALDEALSHLATEDPVAARVVELRHFGGLGHAEIAHVLAISVYQARQKWTYARAWLHHALAAEE